MLKLLNEGYTGVLMTMSNDSMAGSGASIGEIVAQNERDTREVAQRLGLNDAFPELSQPQHGWVADPRDARAAGLPVPPVADRRGPARTEYECRMDTPA